jgi:hypothetical protein
LQNNLATSTGIDQLAFMKRKRSSGGILLGLAVLLVVLAAVLGIVIIGPDVLAWRTLVDQQQALEMNYIALTPWVLPPTWTPGAPYIPTPTVTLIPLIPFGPRRSMPTAPLWQTPILPETPLAARLENKPEVIGTSVKGRLLEVFRFGQGPDQRMIVAGIHGGYEWNTIALVDELMSFLNDHLEWLPPNNTLYILRSLNPDGEAAGQGLEGHNNANGVDLNRNWDANWRANWPRQGCFRFGSASAGELPGSEPETQALMVFLAEHQIRALVSYHSAGPGIYASGDPPHLDSDHLAQELSRASGYIYPGPVTGCLYTGTLVDWVHNALGIASVDVELRNHYETDFSINVRLLAALLHWSP